MTTVTQAEFARIMGVARSTVSRTWKKAGRLVMAGDLVDVDASRQRLRETSGGRDDVSARHAANRGAEIPVAQPDEENAPAAKSAPPADTGKQPRGVESRADAQARKESAAADLMEIELAQKRGDLIPKEDVDAALKAFGAAVRAALDVFPDQTAPLVAPVIDMDEVHALLSESCRNVLAMVADHLHNQERAAAEAARP